MRKKPQYTGLEILEKKGCRRMFYYLKKNGESYYSEMKRELNLNNGMATYTLHELEKAGLVVVERPDGENAGKKNRVRISGTAKALLARKDKEKKRGNFSTSLSVGEYLNRSMEMENDG